MFGEDRIGRDLGGANGIILELTARQAPVLDHRVLYVGDTIDDLEDVVAIVSYREPRSIDDELTVLAVDREAGDLAVDVDRQPRHGRLAVHRFLPALEGGLIAAAAAGQGGDGRRQGAVGLGPGEGLLRGPRGRGTD